MPLLWNISLKKKKTYTILRRWLRDGNVIHNSRIHGSARLICLQTVRLVHIE